MHAFSHEALLYRSPEDFLDLTAPFVREGVSSGEPVMVALVEERLQPLQSALGDEAAAVRFVDMGKLGRNPARILPAWQRFVADAGGRPARGIGEPVWPGRGPDEVDECMRHERLLNVAFADGPPFKLVCPYDAGAFDDDMLAAVDSCHGPRPRVGDPLEGVLAPPPARARRVAFAAGDLAMVRALAADCAREGGLDAARALDLALAVGEVAANSIRHGGGAGVATFWSESGSLLCEVTDAGRIRDPLVGRVAPDAESVSGRGLWIANQLADLVRIRSGEAGTAVRLHLGPGRPEPQ